MSEYNGSAGAKIEAARMYINRQIIQQVKSRAFRASNELRNASQMVLRGQRSGRQYIVPGTGRVKYNKRKKTAKIYYRKYTASAPGEPPAVRTGAFRASWQRRAEIVTESNKHVVVKPYIESNTRTDGGKYVLGEILENGTPGGKMAPRPYKKKIKEHAKNKIVRIYKEPYF